MQLKAILYAFAFFAKEKEVKARKEVGADYRVAVVELGCAFIEVVIYPVFHANVF